ncbi:MAG: hypothetical protein V4717_03950 [Bacteroidota bacterium]
MKQIFTLILTTLLTTTLISQDLTGIWRGSFYNIREVMMGGARYRYEVQIDNKGKNVKGVTYSYQTTRFYGKASLVGMWTPGTNNLVMKEEKMEDLKIEGGGEGCLMTCYLDYRKEGDKEYLEGTYTSRNMNNGNDCGGGKVFLERVVDSDFEKEDFLKKKNDSKTAGKLKPGQEDYLVNTPRTKPATPAKKPVAKAPVKKPTTPGTTKVVPKKTVPATKKPVTPPVAKTTTPPVKKPVVGSNKPVTTPKKTDSSASKQVTIAAKPPANRPVDKDTMVAKKQPTITKLPAPPVLKQRKNELFETITTSSKEITISFYDNGEIDGDTISVYNNNRLLVRAKGLTANPINLTVQLDENENVHEIVMVAENLGSIPPNTALMIVQAGRERYTVRLSSNEQKNAMVRFRYDPALKSSEE